MRIRTVLVNFIVLLSELVVADYDKRGSILDFNTTAFSDFVTATHADSRFMMTYRCILTLPQNAL